MKAAANSQLSILNLISVSQFSIDSCSFPIGVPSKSSKYDKSNGLAILNIRKKVFNKQ